MPQLPPDATPAQYLAARYATVLARVVADLRNLADAVERVGDPTRTHSGEYHRPAGRVVQEIHGSLANLGLTALLDAARDADNAATPKKG
jgi:hypothetical protein